MQIKSKLKREKKNCERTLGENFKMQHSDEKWVILKMRYKDIVKQEYLFYLKCRFINKSVMTFKVLRFSYSKADFKDLICWTKIAKLKLLRFPHTILKVLSLVQRLFKVPENHLFIISDNDFSVSTLEINLMTKLIKQGYLNKWRGS